MVEGFIIDIRYGGETVSSWYQGKPKKSFWTGLKIKRDQLHPISAFRCEKCGYLELYAQKKRYEKKKYPIDPFN
ncbi:MAG: hypothetical protein ACXAEU_13815 [Candidatus Hodarchaeales archaeon]|jgi:ribosomal protein L40E